MYIPRFLRRTIITLSNRWPWLARKISKAVINQNLSVCRHRPHPWSTVHSYVSWASLSDRLWSARHLPAKRLNPPKTDNLHEFFKRDTERLSSKSTCLFPAFAQYLTDSFIQTNVPVGNEPDDPNRKQNKSTHQLDLCALYGRMLEQTTALRLASQRAGDRGRLKSQQIDGEEYAQFLYDGAEIKQEFRVLDPPLMASFIEAHPEIRSKLFAFGGERVNASPQVAMMNTLFLREHNRLAGVIEKANTEWDDERVFQVARNVTIVLFIKVVVEEYINHIAPDPIFIADPTIAWNAAWNKPNWLTTEFSLLYRWHSLVPNMTKWGDKEYGVLDTLLNNDPLLKVGLQEAFVGASAQRAGEIGAFNTASDLLHFEELAIEQGRICELASYADYREYVSLSRPESFADVSSNPDVRRFLEGAYHSVNDIEFYIGLFAEDLRINEPLPPLLRAFVAVDAFSQALTNPLLSEHVWKEETFTKAGWKVINETGHIRDILGRNVEGGLGGDVFVGMTQSNWKPK